MIRTADDLGANPADLFAVMNQATGGTFDTAIKSKTGHLGLIQFGPNEQKKYGVKPDQDFEEQLGAAAQFLKDRGWKPGMGLPHMFSIIAAGSLRKNGEPRLNARGPYGSVRDLLRNVEQNWYPKPLGSAIDTIREPSAAPATKTMPLPTPRPNVGASQSVEPVSSDINDLIRLGGAGNLLSDAPRALLSPPTPPSSVTMILEKGAGKEQPDPRVEVYQKTLKERGYYTGKVDGKFGNMTENAVQNLQRDMGLSVTGAIDEATMDRLEALRSMTRGINARPTARAEPAKAPAPPADLVQKAPLAGQKPEELISAPAREFYSPEPMNPAVAANPLARRSTAAIQNNLEIALGQGLANLLPLARPELVQSLGMDRAPRAPSFSGPVPRSLPAADAPALVQKALPAVQPDAQAVIDSLVNEVPAETPVKPAPEIRQAFIPEPGPLQGIRQFLVDQGIANPSILGPGVDITLTGDGKIMIGKSVDASLSADLTPAPPPAEPAVATPPIDYKGMEPGSVPATERTTPAPASPWIGQPALDPMERRLEFQKRYDQMAPGTIYVDPDGKTRRKSGGAKGKSSSVEGDRRTATLKQTASTEDVSAEDLARTDEWEQLLDSYLEQGVIDPEQREQMRIWGPDISKGDMKRVKGRTIPQDPKSKLNIFNRLPARFHRQPKESRAYG